MPISYWLILGSKKHSILTLKKDAAKLFWGIFFVTDKAQAFSEGEDPHQPPLPLRGGKPPSTPPPDAHSLRPRVWKNID